MTYTATYHWDFVETHKDKAKEWWPSTRNGTTGQGHTYETVVLGKKEDNRAEWDAFNSEVKTSSAKSPNARVRLFTHAFGVEKNLLTRYGKIGKNGTRRFARQVRSQKPRNWGGEAVELGLGDETITLTAPSWQAKTCRDQIDTVLDKKLGNLVYVKTEKRKSKVIREDGKAVDYDYRYPSFTFFGALRKDSFWELFDNSRIAVEFRVKDGKDNGTSFNISKRDIPLMYDFVYEWQGG